ncbi:DUF805 domain-containing protein [Streptomyces polyrhachis]|uniref:DUF805 domain-containing protein n=1 Tax=Streptomyces polyrhachis TaxID=1282885 RepID=A0ABW2GBH1_9ACTN
MSWYLAVLKNYAGFSGRARRKEYWMFTLFTTIVAMVLLGIGAAGAAADVPALFALVAVYYVATIIPSLAVTVRRLHDTGRSGGWFFIAFVPMIGGVWLFVLTLLDSQAEANEYGPNPKFAGMAPGQVPVAGYAG